MRPRAEAQSSEDRPGPVAEPGSSGCHRKEGFQPGSLSVQIPENNNKNNNLVCIGSQLETATSLPGEPVVLQTPGSRMDSGFCVG